MAVDVVKKRPKTSGFGLAGSRGGRRTVSAGGGHGPAVGENVDLFPSYTCLVAVAVVVMVVVAIS